ARPHASRTRNWSGSRLWSPKLERRDHDESARGQHDQSFARDRPERDVLSFFAKPTGLNISYDAGVPDRVITIELDGVTSQQALDDIMAVSQLSYKVLDERSILVFPDPKNVKHEARTDAAGYFQLGDLPAGSYVLQIRQAGFANLLDTFTLSEGQAVQRTIAM